MKKQKVLIAHNYYQVPGGEDTVVENEKNLLLDNGHEVVLYTRHNDEIKSRGILGKLILPFETIFSVKTYKDIKRKIKDENIDIVHVHNTLPLISLSVYYAAKKCNVKVIQTLHNFRFICPNALFIKENNICESCIDKGLFYAIKNKCYRNSFLQSAIIAINIKVHRLIGSYNKVDKYIALTEFSKKKFENIINPEKINIKPNFVKEPVCFKINKGNYFIYVGRIDKLKGIEILLNAWKEINNENLVIVGTGPEENNMIKFIEDNNIENVKFLGYKEKKEVLNLISKSKGLILPSQCYENFPMTIAECFSLGVPAIGGNIGNLATIIKDKENGMLFEYNNYKDLVKVIKELSINIELLENISKGAKIDYLDNYNDRINYIKLIEIYNS